MPSKLQGLFLLATLTFFAACNEEEYFLQNETTVRGKIRLADIYGDLLDAHDGVSVKALGGPSQLSTLTDADGYYELKLSTGVYDLQLTKEGFNENRLLNVNVLGDKKEEAIMEVNGVAFLYKNSSLPIKNVDIAFYTDTISQFFSYHNFFDSTGVIIRGEIAHSLDSLELISLTVFASGIPLVDIASKGYNQDSTTLKSMTLIPENVHPIGNGSYFEVDLKLGQLINGREARHIFETSNEAYFQIYASQNLGRRFPSLDRSRYLVSGLKDGSEIIKIPVLK